MPLTDQMKFPEAEKEKEKRWTSRVVYSVGKITETITKTFAALEIVLFFGILISGIGELMGRKLSLGWYVVVVVLLIANIYLKVVKSKPESLT